MRRSRHPYGSPDAALVYSGSSSLMLGHDVRDQDSLGGQIVVVFAIVLATMWAATQWVAWKLGYQPQLGQPWFELTSGVPVYLPPAFFWRAREAKTAATYGSTRWATRSEIRAAGLAAPDGAVLGRFERDYLRHDGPEHVLCFAPIRSGKGVGLVVPTLLTWRPRCDAGQWHRFLRPRRSQRHGRRTPFRPTRLDAVRARRRTQGPRR